MLFNKIRGISRGENFSFDIVQTPLTTPAIVDEAKSYTDMDYLRSITEITSGNFRSDVTIGSIGSGVLFSVLTGEADVDAVGNVSITLTDGIPPESVTQDVSISMDAGDAGSKSYRQIVTTSGGTLTTLFTAFDAVSDGSGNFALGLHLTSQLEGIISGKTGGTSAAQGQWTSFTNDMASPVAVLNPDCIIAGLNISSTSVMRSNGVTNDRDEYPCMLVSDRHVVGAFHTWDNPGQGIGEVVKFYRESDDTFHDRTIDALTKITDTDLVVMKLSVPLTGFTPYRVPPKDYLDTYAPSVPKEDVQASLPVICKVQHNEVDGAESWWGLYGARSEAMLVVPEYGPVLYDDPVQSQFLPFHNGIISGDSGSPNFLLVNNELVLFGSVNVFSGGADPEEGGGAFCVSRYWSEINDIMNAQSGTTGVYALQHVDFSGFKAYTV